MVTDLSDTCRQGLGRQESGSWLLSSSSLSLGPQQVGTSAPGLAGVPVWQILSVPSEGSLWDGGPSFPHPQTSVPGRGQHSGPSGLATPQKDSCHRGDSDSLVTSQGFSGTVPRRHKPRPLGTNISQTACLTRLPRCQAESR